MDIAEASRLLQQVKGELIAATDLSKDALHVHIGLLLFVAVRLVWRRRGGWALAWAAALAAALTGEWLDMRGEALIGVLQPDSAHWHDVWNTMLWPTVLALVGRWLEPRRAELRGVELVEAEQAGGAPDLEEPDRAAQPLP
jgi:hypothetical protein